MFVKPKKIKRVYLDNAATTQVDERVFESMQPFFVEKFGNPSSLYAIGRQNQKAINEARKTIANLIGGLSENIIFTGSGTESDNMAIYGVANAHKKHGKHIISVVIEHHAVLHPLEDLQKDGFEITYIKVDEKGFVNSSDIAKAIRKDTILITIMHANNEIGTVQPIADIGREIIKYRKKNNTAFPYFHTDACQSVGYLEVDVEKLHTDLLSFNGSKIYGPKGVGVLYLRRGVKIKPLILGGSQEKGLRAGTENVPSIIGLTKALELVQNIKDKESKRLQDLTLYFWKSIQEKIPDVKLNGSDIGDKRLPNNLNVTFMNVEGEAMLLYLDEYGIMCSTGSACTSDLLDPSHVLLAIGLPYEMAHGSLRFTFGHNNNKSDIDYIMKYLPGIIERLREISPVNMKKQQHPKYKK